MVVTVATAVSAPPAGGDGDFDIKGLCSSLDQLGQLAARGNEQAITLLWLAGASAGLCLRTIVEEGDPEALTALRRLAARASSWPVLTTPLDPPEYAAQVMRSIGLGAELPFDVYSHVRADLTTYLAVMIVTHVTDVGAQLRKRRSGTHSTESTESSGSVSGSVKHQRLPMYSRSAAKLPPLSRASLPRWWRVVAVVFDQWFPHPFAVPWMRKLAHNRATDRQVRRVVKLALRQKLAGLALEK